jgi:hypothetical protein
MRGRWTESLIDMLALYDLGPVQESGVPCWHVFIVSRALSFRDLQLQAQLKGWLEP